MKNDGTGVCSLQESLAVVVSHSVLVLHVRSWLLPIPKSCEVSDERQLQEQEMLLHRVNAVDKMNFGRKSLIGKSATKEKETGQRLRRKGRGLLVEERALAERELDERAVPSCSLSYQHRAHFNTIITRNTTARPDMGVTSLYVS